MRSKKSKKIKILSAATAFFLSFLTGAEAASFRGTNVSVDSRELEPFSIEDKKKGEDEKFYFFREGDTAMDINEDGDPNLNFRF
ncbi:MAG: hypothetical protein HYT89_02890 [Candidatus Omnitrophica bacterium]|nr:hypothetical protein [Candidatus Omnitrophota bacterium]